LNKAVAKKADFEIGGFLVEHSFENLGICAILMRDQPFE
jgi:hypothetical protein